MWVPTKGNVTLHRCIAGYTSGQIEERLGFEAGRLLKGYEVFELRSPVHLNDFIWADETTISGGWVVDASVDVYYIQRSDAVRGKYVDSAQGNYERADKAFKHRMLDEQRKLNVRDGPNRIVKVVPTIRHDSEKDWRTQYPNSKIRGTPQWDIFERPYNEFVFVATVPPGGIYY